MSSDEPGQRRERASVFGRQQTAKYDRTQGRRRRKRSMEEKLRKLEVDAAGFEFIPLAVHLLARYTAGIPRESLTEVDRRLAAALGEIEGGQQFAEQVVRRHNDLPYELKRQVFSPRYLNLAVERPVTPEELGIVLERAQVYKNRPVVSLATLPKGHTEGCCCPPPGGPPDERPPPTRPPNQYDVMFQKLYYVDESDPEFGLEDEPYAVFGTITEEMAEAGTAARAVRTPVYEDVDDGETRPPSGDQNLRLWGFTGPRNIPTSVLITTSFFENDGGGDAADKTTKEIRAALTTVATTAAGAGGVAGWVVAGIAVVGIGITYLVDLITDDDAIGGTLALVLTQADADALTASLNPHVLPPLHFDGGDDDGIYDVYLKLRRV
jgi:hypothetical protein